MEGISENSGITFSEDYADKLGSKVSDADAFIKMRFIRKVFGIIALQLIISSLITSLVLFTPITRFYVNENPWLVTVAFLTYAVLLSSLFVKRRQTPMNSVLLVIFTFVEAYSAAVIVAFFDQLAILLTLITLSIVIITLILYSFHCHHEFNSWHAGFFSIMTILIMSGLLQMLFGSTYMEVLCSAFGALVFSLYMVHDVQKIMYKVSAEEYIVGAIDLYLDIFNIFSCIIIIMGQLRKKLS